jgi:ribosomal protein S18 acetylase RimI-like enzyme
VIVRLAEPAELSAVGELTVAAYRADEFLDEDDDYAAILRDTASRHDKATLLVADDEAGGLLGTVTFCLAGTEYAQVAGPGEAEFRMLAVAPEARGKGVGERLTRECIRLAEEAGCTAVTLSSLPVMQDAHRLYGRLGFARDPARDWEPFEGLLLLGYTLDLDRARSAGRAQV